MLVFELIEELKKLPQESPVIVDSHYGEMQKDLSDVIPLICVSMPVPHFVDGYLLYFNDYYFFFQSIEDLIGHLASLALYGCDEADVVEFIEDDWMQVYAGKVCFLKAEDVDPMCKSGNFHQPQFAKNPKHWETIKPSMRALDMKEMQALGKEVIQFMEAGDE